MEVITTHTNADFDTLASMLAAKKLYPNAHLVFPGSKERGVRDFLLKSTIYAFELERAKEIKIEAIERLILVDIRQASRIGRFAEILYKPGLDIHIYDHHPSNPDDIKGNLEYTLPYGSTTTILVHILKERDTDISPQEATAMLLGIYEDTGSLTYPSTTVKDFEAAAFLLSKGGDLKIVSDMLTKELTVEELSLLNEMVSSAATYTIEGIDVVITQAIVEHHIRDVALLVHKIRDICNVNVIFSLIMMEDKIHFVARSRIKEVDVGEIAKEFGGGGHPNAASATIKDMTLMQAKEKLISILAKKILPRKRAGDMMSSPPITISPTHTLKEAKDCLTRYNINALPVVDGNRVVGIVTREIVEKALYHGLDRLYIEEYMSHEFEEVDINAPLSRVQEVIIEHNQPLLPVVENSKLVGVITRTDLLRCMHEATFEERPYLANKKEFVTKRRYIKGLMEDRLPKRIFELLKDAGSVADRLNFKAYAVGGFVRDIFLGNRNLDVDIVIEGDGIVFTRMFAEKFHCQVRSHKRFGTATIIFPDGFKIDVATARLEYYNKPGALPTIEKSSIKLDLFRRDFTINTLAISLNQKNFGELLDFYGGLKDIKSKTLRVLHNLSFVEDPTRVLRAVRFEQRFGFVLGKYTIRLIKNAVKLNIFKQLSSNRLFTELKAILKEDVCIKILKRLGELNLLKFIHPEIVMDRENEELLERTRDCLSWFHLLYLKEDIEEWLVIYLSMTDPLEQEELIELSKRLGISGKGRWSVIEGRRDVPQVIKSLSRSGIKDSEIYYILKPFKTENLLYMMAKTKDEDVKRLISTYVTHLRGYRPKLSGDELKSFGIPEGPFCGEVLNALLKKGLNGEVKTREEEIEYVKGLLKNGKGMATFL